MGVSAAKTESIGILPGGFEELKRRIKARGYVRRSFIKRGEELVEVLEEALRRIEREFGDIVTSIYVVGKVARGQVDDFIGLVIIMKKMFGSFMPATHGVFVEKVFEPMLLEDEDMDFILDPLYFTPEEIFYPFPTPEMRKVIKDLRQNGILICGIDILDEN